MAIDQPKVGDSPGSGVGESKTTFLSYSSEDRALAGELCASLEARGFTCWIAPRDIAPGQPWALACLQGVAESSSLTLLASEHALASVQVLSEVEQAHKRRKPIYTVLIPPTKMRGEMDFYLSRLHWIESGGRTAEDLAAKLAPVLGKRREWNEVAAPPSLRRTMLYRPVAFARLVAATVLGMLLVLGGLLYALNRKLDTDFRRLGYVDLAAEVGNNGRIVGHARVWLMAEGIPFADARLLIATKTTDGKVSQQQFSAWPVPEQVGSQEMVAIPFEPATRQLTTCLIVPRPGLTAPYRVTQDFILTQGSDGVRVSETAEPRVNKEDGSPCG